MTETYARYFNGTGWLEPMYSYSQNFEDVTLRRGLLDIDIGFYVDIGGYDPNSHSVTRHFYDKGWSGVNVEPNAVNLKKFEAHRPRDINVGVAVGREDGEINLHIIGDTGLTTTVEAMAKGHATSGFETTSVVPTKMMTLENLLRTYCSGKTIDFLKIDVEGAEPEVVLPYSFEEFRPRIIVVENGDGYNDHLVSKGYIFCWYDGLNRWYVRTEDTHRCDLVARPPSLWDQISNAPRGE